jgi:hypothetical protein
MTRSGILEAGRTTPCHHSFHRPSCRLPNARAGDGSGDVSAPDLGT